MLYLIHMANHPELTYRGGQDPIVHLQADLFTTIAWAGAHGQRWAFSLSNAGAYYTEFRSQIDQLGDINWPAVATNDFRSPDVKEGKQAEFLLHSFFPWELVEQIGVYSHVIEEQVIKLLQANPHRPPVARQPAWYY